MSASNGAMVEMQRQLSALALEVGKVSGKLDTFINQLAAHDDRTTDLEVRTRKVEGRQHWYAGAGTIVGAVFARFAPGVFGHG